jgi:hypothetical protein
MDGLFGKATVSSENASVERGDVADGKKGRNSPKVEEVLGGGDEKV